MIDWFWIVFFQITSVFFAWLWIRQSTLIDRYRCKFEVADELGKFQSDKADGLLAELEESQKNCKECEKVAKDRLETVQCYFDGWAKCRDELIEANQEIAKLKAENAALKDWQPMKDSIEKMLSGLMSPIDSQIAKSNKYSPVTCVAFEEKPGTVIRAENHELDYKNEDRG